MASAISSPAARPPSLRLRIAATVAGFALLVILAQAIALLLVLNEQEEDYIDEILNRQIAHSLKEYADDPAAAAPNTPHMRLFRAPPDASSEAPPRIVAGLTLGNHEVYEGPVEYHVAVRQQDGARYFLMYDVRDHEERIDTIIFLTLAGVLAIGLVTLASVYALAGRLTRRLDTLALRVAQARPAGSYAEPGMEREVLAVARALDASDARQAELLARERDFTSNLSHELRTPLTGIRTDAELLAQRPDLAESDRLRAQRIVDTADRIGDLTRSLLLLAREAQPMLEEDVSLREAVLHAWAPLAGPARDKGLRLECAVPPEALVHADAGLLQLTLRNLLDNAVRHSAAGEIRCGFEEGRLVVQDCGPGIPAQDLDRVFERYYRGAAGSHGIGLALVRHVCSACGWQATAGNGPQGGARFSIDFGPAARSSQIPHTSLTDS